MLLLVTGCAADPVLGIWTPAGATPALAASPSLSEDFNDDPVGRLPRGWTAAGSAEVAAVPDTVDRSLTVSAGTATARFAPLAGTVQVEARVRVEQPGGPFDVLDVGGSDRHAALSVTVRDGRFEGAGRLPAAAHRWYALRAVLRTGAHRYDLYVDGRRVVTDAPLRRTVADVRWFTVGAPKDGTLRVDAVSARRVPDPSVDYAVFDQFNDAAVGAAPAGYRIDGDASVAAVPSDADRSLRLVGTATATRTFARQTGVVQVRATVRTDEVSGTKLAVGVQSSRGRTAAAVEVSDGALVYHTGTAAHRLTDVNPGEWYTLRLVLDVPARQVEVTVDGRRFASGTSAAGVPQRWAFHDADVADLSRLLFATAGGDLTVDNVMAYTSPLDRPPGTVLDVRQPPYHAVGDGRTDDTDAIQRAIDAVPPGGSVLLADGVYLTGTLLLKSDMTLWVDRDAVLLGTTDDAGYPEVDTAEAGSRPVGGIRKALLLSVHADNVAIDGGGTIDGNGGKPQWAGDSTTGSTAVRPTLLFLSGGHNVSVRDVHVRNAASWAVVPANLDGVLIADIDIDSNLYANRDGIDVVDSHSVLVERVDVWSDDDSICFKSYSPRGVDGAVVRLSTVGRSERANGVKFGTESAGAFRDVVVEDVLVKHVDKAAVTVTAVDGAVVTNLAFRRVTVDHALRAFFVLLGRRAQSSREPRVVSGLDFESLTGTGLSEPAALSGQSADGATYRLYAILVSDVHQTITAAAGGDASEYTGAYPESNLFTGVADSPARGYFLRHVDAVTIRASTTAGARSTTAGPPPDVQDANLDESAP